MTITLETTRSGNTTPFASRENSVHSSPYTYLSNTQKVDIIFESRSSILSQMRTNQKIQTVVSIAIALIGISCIVAGCVLAASGGLPIVAAVVIVISGEILGLLGALTIRTRRILKEEEEKAFWKAISVDTLGELSNKRWNWHCVGAPYFGPVDGVCKISYKELVDHKIMCRESARILQSFIQDYQKGSETQKVELQHQFDIFRNKFINEAYYINHKR